MKHWIGVISSKAIYDSVIKGEHNWFCLNAKVEVGDTFFLFATSKVTKDSGLFGHFEVVNVDPNRNNECRMYGGTGSSFASRTVFTEFKCLSLFADPVSFADLKNDETTRYCTGVTRSFRGTCFPLSAASYAAILKMVN